MPTYIPKPSSCQGCPWETVSVGFADSTGPSAATLALVAESAGDNEAQQGRALVGWTGQQVNNLLEHNGVKRDEVYCDNVVRCKPPPAKKGAKLPKEVIEFCTQQHLLPALQAIKPNCIIALGDYSLQFLTGHKGITKWRGSLIHSESFGKVVPTFHPAALMKGEGMAVYWPFVDFDFAKAIRESKTAAYVPPEENFNINPTIKDVMKFVKRARDAGRVSIDIETSGGSWWNTAPLCIGMCIEEAGRYEAICIPFYGYKGQIIWSEEEMYLVIKMVDAILSNSSIIKVFQNCLYDVQVLESIGWEVK